MTTPPNHARCSEPAIALWLEPKRIVAAVGEPLRLPASSAMRILALLLPRFVLRFAHVTAIQE
jgi:hypothetical protein